MLMANRTVYAVPGTATAPVGGTVHVLQQLAHVIRGHADVSQDLLPAGPGEVDPVGLEHHLHCEVRVELLLLDQLPAALLQVPLSQRVERIEVGLVPAVLVRVPVPGAERGAGFGAILGSERARDDHHEMGALGRYGFDGLFHDRRLFHDHRKGDRLLQGLTSRLVKPHRPLLSSDA